jgi:HAMP domain-containing protein
MDQRRFERRLRQASFSRPSITLEEVAERVAQTTRRRRGQSLVRLAVAVAAAWGLAWAAEVGVERGLQAVAPMSRSVAVAESEGTPPPALLERRELLEKLVADGWSQQGPAEAPKAKQHGAQSQSKRDTVGRLDYV